MSSCLSENTIAEVLDDKLSPDQRQLVAEHIDVCGSCRSLVAHLIPVADPVKAPAPSAPAAANFDDTFIGRSIGPYKLVRRLGRGGMGTVYEAFYPYIGRRAAVKILLPSVADDPQIVVRFLNEGRAVNRIRHPNIVDIYEVEQLPDGTAYLLMEFLEGDSLKTRLDDKGALGAHRTVRIGRQLASALCAAHAQGIVHRDLKPSNVMLSPDAAAIGGERAKLLDFGIAKMPVTGEAAAFSTLTDQILGTPIYMAPEQCHGARDVTAQADVYALGVMFFHMLAGHPPFEGSVGSLIAAHLHTPPPSLPSPDTQPAAELATLTRAMLSKPPHKRPTMAEVEARLERIDGALATGEQRAVRSFANSRVRIFAVVASVLALFAGAYLVMRAQKKEPPPPTFIVPVPVAVEPAAPTVAATTPRVFAPPAEPAIPNKDRPPRSAPKRVKRPVTNDDVPIFHP